MVLRLHHPTEFELVLYAICDNKSVLLNPIRSEINKRKTTDFYDTDISFSNIIIKSNYFNKKNTTNVISDEMGGTFGIIAMIYLIIGLTTVYFLDTN